MDPQAVNIKQGGTPWIWPLIKRGTVFVEENGWYLLVVAMVLVVFLTKIEPVYYKWRRSLGSPAAVQADKSSVRAARTRQAQRIMLESREHKKKMGAKKRAEFLDKKKKPKVAGFAPVENQFDGPLGGHGSGSGRSYRPSGAMRRQGGGG